MEKKAHPSCIGKRVSLDGTLTFKKKLIVCGQFSGCVNGGEMLVVEQGAMVDATIDVDTIVVRGSVQGKITAHASVLLEAGSIVEADIHTPDIRIAENAQYQGECVMSLDQIAEE